MDHLKTWLEHEQAPKSFYELLGVPCLSDDREMLVSMAKSVTRFLHQYQNHKNKQVVERARRLQLLCARAAYTFSSDAEWKSYDRQILNRIHEEYRQKYCDDGLHRTDPDVRIWLRETQNVANHRIDEVLKLINSTGSAIHVKPNPPGSSPSVSSTIVLATSQRPVPPPIPQQTSATIRSSSPFTTPPAQRPNSAYGMNDPDRRIWQLTGLFLTLSLLGSIWLWFQGRGRIW